MVNLPIKDRMNKCRHFVPGFALVLWACVSLRAQTAPLTNTVVGTSSLTAYTVDGQPNLALSLQRGITYVFQVNEATFPFHPFYIKTNFTALGATDQYTNGVTGNGTTGGNLIFSVPTNAPNVLYYHCGNHGPMGAMLTIVSPPSPPSGQIVLITISDTGVTMRSLGASNWTAIPEFNSNLTLNAWAAVPNFTNTFLNGTNTTTFNRLDPICGPNVFLRVRNQSQ
jgi:hypothetical protein